tara:strand:+ start:9806 stop:10627 length:822 start_codon:yes stop_codon:yes gene_type:complete
MNYFRTFRSLDLDQAKKLTTIVTSVVGTFGGLYVAHKAQKKWQEEKAHDLVVRVQEKYCDPQMGKDLKELGKHVEKYARVHLIELGSHGSWECVLKEMAFDAIVDKKKTDDMKKEIQERKQGTFAREEKEEIEVMEQTLQQHQTLDQARRNVTQYWELVRFTIEGFDDAVRDETFKRLTGNNCDRLHLFFLACMPLNWAMNATVMTERIIRDNSKERDRESVTQLHDYFRRKCIANFGDECVFSVREIEDEAREKKIRDEIISVERKNLGIPI